eukprot:TRINITY_DN3417_c0_g1_i5.p1 TRINITY_DN3417_c0_g1~~TRINITY_DN3417_c0_g1_i5.p1  ORF type:complete len:1934 (-),score=527.70 TRINITY_DN3417_c0_g1_i5:36-5837(-)
MGILDNLQADFRALAEEGRRKFPAIKDAAERAIMKVRAAEEQPADRYGSVMSRSEDVLRPILLACDTKQPKMVTGALSALQKLVSLKAISHASLPSVLSKLHGLAESGEEGTQLKVIQTLVTLLTTMEQVHGPVLGQALTLAFKLHASKNPTVHNSTSATLRQIITMLFDRTVHELESGVTGPLPGAGQPDGAPGTPSETHANTNTNTNADQHTQNGNVTDSTADTTQPAPANKDDTPPSSSSSSSVPSSPMDAHALSPRLVSRAVPTHLAPYACDTYLLLSDLCHLASADTPVWLPIPPQMFSRPFALELIELALDGYPILFEKIPEFTSILKDRVCPLVIKSFRMRLDFSNTVRLMRIVVAFIKNYCEMLATECEVFVTRLLKMLDLEQPLYMHTLALESFKIFCESPHILRSFYVHYDMDNPAKLLEQMVALIARYIQGMFQWDPSHFVYVHGHRNRILDQLWVAEPGVVAQPYVLSISVECLIGLVNAIALTVGSLMDEQASITAGGEANATSANNTANTNSNTTTTTNNAHNTPIINSTTTRVHHHHHRPSSSPAMTSLSPALSNSILVPSPAHPSDPLSSSPPLSPSFLNSSHIPIPSIFPATPAFIESPTLPRPNLDTDSDNAQDTAAPTATETNTNADSTLPSPTTTTTPSQLPPLDTPQYPPDYEISRNMADITWPAVLAALSSVLTRTQDEALVQLILKAQQSFVFSSGALKLPTPRDAFLTSLCKTSLPPNYNMMITMLETETIVPSNKNIQAVKTLLNIAHCFGNVLDDGWMLVIENLEHWDKILKSGIWKDKDLDQSVGSPGGARASPQALPPTALPTNTQEFTLLNIALNTLFKSSSQLDDNAINCLLRALVRTSTASLAVLSSLSAPMGMLQSASAGSISVSSNSLLGAGLPAPVPPAPLGSIATPNASTSSLALLGGTGALPTPPHVIRQSMFGLHKIVDVVLQNVFRADLVWNLVGAHLVEAGTNRRDMVRAYAIDSITQTINAALPLVAAPNRATTSRGSVSLPSSASFPSLASLSGGASSLVSHDVMQSPLQVRMMSALTSFVARTCPMQARDRALHALETVLHSSGEFLSESWPVVLRCLIGVAKDDDKPLVGVAFKSLQLICTDFLSNLRARDLSLFIFAIGSFGRQLSDVNISLTSVGLLWNVADFLVMETANQTSSYLQLENTAEPVPENSDRSFYTVVPPSPGSRMEQRPTRLSARWLGVFGAMKTLATDMRPEVRNCALITLFKTLTTHGQHLGGTTWEACLWGILFPLIEDVKMAAASAANDRIDSDLGNGMVMLVHHSRNTAQKQWDETKVLAMGGIARLFKVFFEVLSELPHFSKSWDWLVQFIESSARGQSKEVSLAALNCLQDMVASQICNASFPDALREAIWEALEGLSRSLAGSPDPAPKALDVLLTSVNDIYIRTSSQQSSSAPSEPSLPSPQPSSSPSPASQLLPSPSPSSPSNPTSSEQDKDPQQLPNVVAKSVSDARRVLRILLPLAMYPPDYSNEASFIQLGVLSLAKRIPDMVHDHLHDIFPDVVHMLLNSLSYAIGLKYAKAPFEFTLAPPQANSAKSYHPLAEGCLSLLVDLMLRVGDSYCRAIVFEDILDVVNSCMMTKHSKLSPSIWKSGVACFLAIVPTGLAAVNKHTIPPHTSQDGPQDTQNGDQNGAEVLTVIQRNMIWSDLMDTIQGFLFQPQNATVPLVSQPERAEEEQFDVAIVDLLCTEIVGHASGIPMVHDRFLEIMQEGSALVAQGRDSLAFACYRNMFALCNKPLLSSSSSQPPQEQSSSSSDGHDDADDQDSKRKIDAHIARLIAPVVMGRCSEVLSRFVTDDRQSGSCPLPRSRLAEVSFLLQELLNAQIPPEIYSASGGPRGRTGNRSHLLSLFTVFADCIATSEREVKELLKQIFYLVAQEFLEIYPLAAALGGVPI